MALYESRMARVNVLAREFSAVPRSFGEVQY